MGQHRGSELADGLGGGALFQRFEIGQRVGLLGALAQRRFDGAAGTWRTAVQVHFHPAKQHGGGRRQDDRGNNGDHGSGSFCMCIEVKDINRMVPNGFHVKSCEV